jgi:hypothetical protein
MPKLVWRSRFQSCFGRGAGEFVAQGVPGDPPSLVSEQEVHGLAGAGMRQRLAGGTVLGDPVEQLKGFGIDGHHPFGVQLAQRHLQPGTGAGDLVHAVQFEVDEFTDAQAGGAQQQQGVGAEPIR